MKEKTFAERKAERTLHYELHVKGRKLVTCGACAGSGYYDHNGSPPCAMCNGTGKVRETLWDHLTMKDPELRRNGVIKKERADEDR